MEFFKCSIAGGTYGSGVTEIEMGAARRNGVNVKEVYMMICHIKWNLIC